MAPEPALSVGVLLIFEVHGPRGVRKVACPTRPKMGIRCIGEEIPVDRRSPSARFLEAFKLPVVWQPPIAVTRKITGLGMLVGVNPVEALHGTRLAPVATQPLGALLPHEASAPVGHCAVAMIHVDPIRVFRSPVVLATRHAIFDCLGGGAARNHGSDRHGGYQCDAHVFHIKPFGRRLGVVSGPGILRIDQGNLIRSQLAADPFKYRPPPRAFWRDRGTVRRPAGLH